MLLKRVALIYQTFYLEPFKQTHQLSISSLSS